MTERDWLAESQRLARRARIAARIAVALAVFSFALSMLNLLGVI